MPYRRLIWLNHLEHFVSEVKFSPFKLELELSRLS